MERSFTFRYPLFTSFFHANYLKNRIPSGKKMTSISPQNVIVTNLRSIPPRVHKIQFTTFSKPITSFQSLLSLSFLTFGDDFNQDIDTLPPSLRELTLGYFFDRPVDTYLHPFSNLNLEMDLPTKLTISLLLFSNLNWEEDSTTPLTTSPFFSVN
jgi:hypothetical protein